MGLLEGQTAAVTGGARGIGRAIATLFAAEGARVVLMDRDGDGARGTAAELARAASESARTASEPARTASEPARTASEPARTASEPARTASEPARTASEPARTVAADAIEVDVRDWQAVAAAFDELVDRHGGIDVCVNNAGINRIAPSLEMSEEAWRDVVDVNLSGVFACAQAAARHMAPRQSGTIVNIASASGVLALPGRAPYCASKAAVMSLTRVLAVEWAELGIRVNAISPGWVMTDLVRDAIQDGHLSETDIRRRTPLDRLATPEEVAQVALFLATPASSYVTGQTVFPDGGFTAYGSWR